MDLRDLRVFVAIAETGSLASAAQILHIGSPSLSARLKNLESELRTLLFERRARGLHLTDEGREFLPHAYGILKQAEDAKASLTTRDQPPSGSVRLGVPGSLIGLLTVRLIQQCLTELPQIRLRVVESMSGYIASWLRNGTLDAAIVYGGSAATDDSAALRAVAEEELYVATYDPSLVAPFLDADGNIPMADVARLGLIMPGLEHGLRNLVEATARRHGFALNVSQEIDASTQIFELVHCRNAATICSLAALHPSALPMSAAAHPIHTYRVVHPGFTRKVYLATPLNRPSSRATMAVTSLTERTLRQFAAAETWNARLVD